MTTLEELLAKITSKADFVKLEMLNTNPSTGSSGIVTYRIYFKTGSTKEEINTETCDIFVENFNSPGKESARWMGAVTNFVSGDTKSSFETALETKKAAVMRTNPKIKRIVTQLIDLVNTFAIVDAYYLGTETPQVMHKNSYFIYDTNGSLEVNEYS